jgi:hypothetical protein
LLNNYWKKENKKELYKGCKKRNRNCEESFNGWIFDREYSYDLRVID